MASVGLGALVSGWRALLSPLSSFAYVEAVSGGECSQGTHGAGSALCGSCERWKVLQPVWAPSCHFLLIECISLASFLAVARWLDKASMAGKVSNGN